MHPDLTDANVHEPAEGLEEFESASGPTYDEIAERALELYTRRGGADGGADLQDWISTERQRRFSSAR